MADYAYEPTAEDLEQINRAVAIAKDISDDAVEDGIIDEPLTIKIRGTWVWVSGDTKPVRGELNGEGFTWRRNKECWTWRLPKNKAHKWGSNPRELSEEDIERRYGVTVVQGDAKPNRDVLPS